MEWNVEQFHLKFTPLWATFMGQYMRKSCCERNDSNPVHARWCWCIPMHEPKVSALDEHQHQRKCTGFESFLEHQDLRMYWPNSYTSVNTSILRLIYQLNDLKRIYLTVNNTLFTHENVSEPIIAPGRGMFMPMNQSEQALTKDKIIHVPGPSVIYCGKTLLALWDDDMWINSYISTRIFYILLLFKMLVSKITSCAHNSTWVSWCWRALKLTLTWNPVCQ